MLRRRERRAERGDGLAGTVEELGPLEDVPRQRLGRLGRVAGRGGVRRAGFGLAIGPRPRALQALEKLFPRDAAQEEDEERVVLEAVAEQHGERAGVRARLRAVGARAPRDDVAGVQRQERAARLLEGALHVFGQAAREKVGRVPGPRRHRLENAAPAPASRAVAGKATSPRGARPLPARPPVPRSARSRARSPRPRAAAARPSVSASSQPSDASRARKRYAHPLSGGVARGRRAFLRRGISALRPSRWRSCRARRAP